MTNDELRTAIAERLGWRHAPEWREIGTWVAPDGTLWHSCPNWPENIKAALELSHPEYILEIVFYKDGSIGAGGSGCDSVDELAALICEIWLDHQPETKSRG